MYGVNLPARKLSWVEVSKAVGDEIQKILGIFIKCDAIPDDIRYWDIQFRRRRIQIKQLYSLLEAVGADEEMIFETIPCKEDNVLTSSCAGMRLSIALLKRHLNLDWDHQLICQDALWLVGVKEAEEEIWNPTIDIDGRQLSLGELKNQFELISYLQEHGATHSNLMDFCEEYRDRYQNELCWPYPISDGKHLGTFLVLVKEGILSLPYDEAEKEEYELFCMEDAHLFRTEDEIEVFIQDWHSFDSDLRQAMSAMKCYLKARKDVDV